MMETIQENVKLCCWCGIVLGSANTAKEGVCVRCHTSLIDKGIADEDILCSAVA